MGYLDSIFGRKPSATDISAFNYNLFFDYIPKRLHDWEQKKCAIEIVLSFDSLLQKNSTWKSLIKEISISDSTLKKCTDITAYLIKAPSNEQMGEVAMAMIAVNPKIRKFEYFTMEFSLGEFAICTADEKGNHYYMDGCENGEVFGAYVIKQALKKLVPIAPKPTPKPQPSAHAPQPSLWTKEPHIRYNADMMLVALEKIADKYYKEKGDVDLEDCLVTHKVGDSFEYYITQDPDAEYDDPNCEISLMIEIMDHEGRMSVVNKFFPEKSEESAKPKLASSYPSAIKDNYYSLDQLKQIQMGAVRLQPIDAGFIFNTHMHEFVKVFADKSPRIKQFLPNLDLSSSEAMAKYFTIFCQKTEMGMEFGYSIKINKYGDVGVIGMIFVHTPGYNQIAINLLQWTIDFCLFEPFEGKAIMQTSLKNVLVTLRDSMNVKHVFAIVDEGNSKCHNLLAKLNFELLDDTLSDPNSNKKANLYCCSLDEVKQ